MSTFPIAPVTTKMALAFPVLLTLVLGGVIVAFLITAVATRTARFDVLDSGLRLRGDLYGRTVPVDQLRLEEARQVDLTRDAALTPRMRTLGTSMPGYRSGWFRLANGERALLYITDASKAIYIPTTAGYSLLLSPADPTQFLEALRRLPRHAPSR